MDLALNNLQKLICHKTKHTKPLSLAALLSRSAGLLNSGGPEGPIGPLCWVLVLSTASYLQLTDTKTNSTVCRTGLYHCLTSTCFLWASHLHRIQPVTVKAIPWYLRPDAPVNLHRCISYLTARPRVNMLQYITDLLMLILVLSEWGLD